VKIMVGLPSPLIGVYGLMTGFSISGPLYFVNSAEAICSPLTVSSSGRANLNFFVLWLMFSTLSSLRLMKPWSPPVKALFGPALPAASSALSLAWPPFALSSALCAASLTFCELSPWL
jgi:hypothetical protein